MALQSNADLRLFNGLIPVSCFLNSFQHKVLYDPNLWTNFCNGREDLTSVILIQIPYYSYSCSDKYHVRHTTKCIPQLCQLRFLCTPLVLLMLNLALKILVYTMRTKRCSSLFLLLYAKHPSGLLTSWIYVRLYLLHTLTLLANDLLHVN
jgi:hypothetical protein